MREKLLWKPESVKTVCVIIQLFLPASGGKLFKSMSRDIRKSKIQDELFDTESVS